jgi:hypothetical protein
MGCRAIERKIIHTDFLLSTPLTTGIQTVLKGKVKVALSLTPVCATLGITYKTVDA